MWSSKGKNQAPGFGLRASGFAPAPGGVQQHGQGKLAGFGPVKGTVRTMPWRERMSRDPNKLDAFKLADELAILVYEETRRWPAADRDGLRSQLRRAAISSALNIIEGCARRSGKDYARFIDISLGSASEAMYLIDFSNRVGLMATDTHQRCRNLSSRVVRATQKLLDAIQAFPYNETQP
jgi:four helix bundle protein